jgi:hypothetical protein
MPEAEPLPTELDVGGGRPPRPGGRKPRQPGGVAASAAEACLAAPATRAGIIAHVVRRGATISAVVLCLAPILPGTAQATSGHHWRTLTIHQAWTVTVTGARHVAKQAESLPHTYGPSRPSSDEVQPQSACVRHSRYQIDCPFTYFLGYTSGEVYTRCHDTGQVTEIAEQRFRFTSPKPRCQLIYNKTP